MKTTEIHKTDSIPSEYFALQERLYRESEATRAYITDSQKGLDKITLSQDTQPVFLSATRGSELVGHIAIIPFRAGEAFFGFFESIDRETFLLLWERATQEAVAMRVSKLFGPVNGTIWHPYRLVTLSTYEPTYPFEPITRLDYAQWFACLKPSQVIEYHSAYRTDYTPILQATKPSYQSALDNNIEIAIELPSQNNIQELYTLAVEVFAQNPGYVHLSLTDFVSLYSSDRVSKHKGMLYTARQAGRLLGFCFNMEYGKTLIMKTIAVHPSLQQKGIGNALVHRIHSHAETNGFTKVVYALVRKDNNVRHFPTDKITVFREYSAYIFNL